METCQYPPLEKVGAKAVILDVLKCEHYNKKRISDLNGMFQTNISEAIRQISIDDFNAALTESRHWVGSTILRADIIRQFKVDHTEDALKVIDNSFTTSLFGMGGKKSRKYRKKFSITSRRRNKSNKKRKSSRARR
jgi:hypothetical protein